MLKAAFVQALLTKDELDVRAGQTLEPRTSAELAALTADIPAGGGVLTDSVSASRVIVASPAESAVKMLRAAWYWSRSWHRPGAWRGSQCCRPAVVS